jgi:hypothetical protein
VSLAAHLYVVMLVELAAQILVLALAHLLGALDCAVAQLSHDFVFVLRRRNDRADHGTDRDGEAGEE